MTFNKIIHKLNLHGDLISDMYCSQLGSRLMYTYVFKSPSGLDFEFARGADAFTRTYSNVIVLQLSLLLNVFVDVRVVMGDCLVVDGFYVDDVTVLTDFNVIGGE